MCPVSGIEGYDRIDAIVIHKVFVDTGGVVSGVIDCVIYLPFQTMLPESFLQPVHVLHGEGEVRLRGSGDGDMQWQVMTVGGHHMLIVGMTEVICCFS